MKQVYLAPFVIAVVLGCGDSTSPDPTQTSNTVLANLGSMAVGDVRVMTFAQAQNGLTIPSAEATAVYAIITANVAGDTGSVPQYTVLGDHVGSIPILAKQSAVTPVLHPQYTRVGGVRGAQFEAKLRAYERAHEPGFAALARNRQSRPRSSPLRLDNVPVGTVPTVGQQYQFNVPANTTGQADVCAHYTTVTATVQAVSNHAIVLSDNRTPAGGFTSTDYTSVANEFDSAIYPTEVGYFGAPTDIDNNGHVFILYTPAVNQQTPPGTATTVGFVGGFTFIGDLVSSSAEPAGCPESNEGEIFYLLVPDSTAGGGNQYGNTFTTALVREQTRVTMAHEFQHAIIDGKRLFTDGALPESAWLDEALSSLAEDAVGRTELGFSDMRLITYADVKTNLDRDILNTFFFTNFDRTQSYVLRPDTIGALVTDDREEQDVAAFGAGWAFLRYVVDWYSPASNPRTLTQALVAGPDSGTANLTAHAGASLDTLLAHWLITMYTDSRPIQNLPQQYNYRSYNLREIVTGLCANNDCNAPSYLPIHQIGKDTASLTLGIPSSSANYFVTTQFTGGARTIRVTNPGGGTGATYPFGRVYVVRLE